MIRRILLSILSILKADYVGLNEEAMDLLYTCYIGEHNK